MRVRLGRSLKTPTGRKGNTDIKLVTSKEHISRQMGQVVVSKVNAGQVGQITENTYREERKH